MSGYNYSFGSKGGVKNQPAPIVSCLYCGKEYQKQSRTQKYCSKKCGIEARKSL